MKKLLFVTLLVYGCGLQDVHLNYNFEVIWPAYAFIGLVFVIFLALWLLDRKRKP